MMIARNKCTLEKTVYSAVQANIMAEQEISISRKGALCDEAEKPGTTRILKSQLAQIVTFLWRAVNKGLL